VQSDQTVQPDQTVQSDQTVQPEQMRTDPDVAELEISPLGRRRFTVRVRAAGQETNHRVAVPERLAGGPALDDPAALERVVRESFRFLLEREPATSILAEFSLDEITHYFPEYPAELARRLS
jgi:hypothetical protein